MYKFSSFKQTVFSLFTCGVFMLGSTAWATPVISIDLDPTMAGIQSTLSVDMGTSFTIDVVYTGDGIAAFDTFGWSVLHNDVSAGILGLTGGTGMPALGSIGPTAPFLALGPIALGPFPLAGAFMANSDGVSGVSIISPFGFPVPFPATTTHSLFSLTFDALLVGTSTLLPSDGGGLGGLALVGLPVAFSTPVGGLVTVNAVANPIPEPGTMLLMGSGLIGLVAWRIRKPTSV